MKFLLLSILSLFATVLTAQYQINGDAVQLDCNCYELTPDAGSQAGSVWNQNLISLDDAFDFNFTVFLGCNNDGADGIAFAFQPVGTGVGSVGSSMGLAGISPVLSVVIDTYQNPYDTDPNEDHIGINTNGNLAHDGGADDLAGPGLLPDVEDCQWHDFRITWDPATQTLSAYFDGVLISSYTGDIVNDVFSGNPNVFWGLTSATGGASNNHKFCTELLASFTPSDADVCVGQDVTFISDVNSFSPLASLSWEFGDGATSTDIEPTHAYTSNGIYEAILTATDQSGCEQKDTVEINVGGLIDLLTPNTSVCPSEQVGLEVLLDESNYPPCEYTLELDGTPSWFWNYWTNGGPAYVHVYIDGQLFQSYTQDDSQGNTQQFTFSVPHGADVELIFDDGGINNEDELTVSLFDSDNDQMFTQVDLSGMSGSTLYDFTSGCGFVPDYTYSWSPGVSLNDANSLTPTATPTVSTTYYFNLTDNESGCQYEDSVTVTMDQNALIVDATTDAAVICPGQVVQLGAVVTDNTASGDGTYNYTWSPSSAVSSEVIQNPTSSPVSTTVYTVIVTENGSTCTAIDSVEVTANGDPVAVSIDLCENENYTFPDGTAQLVTGDFQQTSVLPTGSGCDSVIVTSVTMIPSFSSTADIEICSGSGIIYADGFTSSDVVAPESHTSVFTNVIGCDSLVIQNVTVTAPITASEDVQICSGTDYTYADGTVSTDVVANESHLSDLTSFSGCDSLLTTNLIIVSTIQIANNITLCPGQSYVYPDGTVLPMATVNESNISSFTSVNGCDSIVTTNITVFDDGSCSEDLPFVEAPNVFTPNGDGSNDYYFIKAVNIRSVELLITNRWGTVVYSGKTDLSTLATGAVYGWNGNTLKGEKVTQGTYFYTYTAVGMNDEVFTGHGHLELIRD